MKAMKESIRYRAQDIYSMFHEAILENGDGRARGRQGMLYGTLCSHVFSHLASGTYFTSLLLAMGADDVYIGYVTMVMTVSSFFQMFAPLFLEKMKRRKTILMIMRSLYHILTIGVLGIIPLMPWEKETILTVFMVVVFIAYILNALGSPGFGIWHIQSLPYEKRVNYFTIQNMTCLATGVCVSYVAGLFLDFFENNGLSVGGLTSTLSALVIMRIIALAVAALEMYFYSLIKEYPYEKDANEKNNRGFRLLLTPLRHKEYMMAISVQLLWTFVAGLIGPYFSVYLIEDVQMSYSFIALGGFISTPIILVMTPIWGKLLQRENWMRLLGMAYVGYSFAFFFNMLITENTQFLYPFAIITANAFSPCISVALANLNYLRMPEQNKTTYLSIYTILTQGTSLLATFVGTQFIGATEERVLNILGFEMVNKQYMNMIQMAGVLLLVLYVNRVGKVLKIGIRDKVV